MHADSANRRPLIVDGGLATSLESMGHRLDGELWSAGVFLEHPAAVEALHREYLAAGAEVLISASYQMSFAGLARAGLDREAATEAMRRTVAVARRAREQHGGETLVAASIGPYGAALGDGSEYSGRYGVGAAELAEFHRPRLEVLRTSGADLLAVETIPSYEEARVLAELLAEDAHTRAWVSFSCRDGVHLADGTPIARAAELLDPLAPVIAIGINCTAPEHVSSLMDEIRSGSGKPIVVYPNSGEVWDAVRRRWSGRFDRRGFCRMAREWADKGAWAIGGCCRIGPDTIRELSSSLA